MERDGLARYAPLAGIVWVVVIVGTFIWLGDTPDNDASTREVVRFWLENDDEQAIGAVIAALGLFFFVWFAGALRSVARAAEGGTGRLSAVSFAGAILFSSGAIVALSLTFAVADTVGDVPPLVTHSVFIVSDDMWLWLPIGNALFLAPVAILAFRTGFLPKSLAWITAILAVISVTPVGFFAWLATLLWIVGVSILLFRRGQAPAAPPPAAATAPPA